MNKDTPQNTIEYDLPDGWYHSEIDLTGIHLFYAVVDKKCKLFYNNPFAKIGSPYPFLQSDLSFLPKEFELGNTVFSGNGFYALNQICRVPESAILVAPIKIRMNGTEIKGPELLPVKTEQVPIALVASGCLLIAGILGMAGAKKPTQKLKSSKVAKQLPAQTFVQAR